MCGAKTLYTHRPLNKYYACGPGLMLSTKLHFQACWSLHAARTLQHRMHATHATNAAVRCDKLDVTPSQSVLTTHKILNKRRVKWWLVYRTRSSVIFIGPGLIGFLGRGLCVYNVFGVALTQISRCTTMYAVKCTQNLWHLQQVFWKTATTLENCT